jgi:CRISPR-associated exonuclease Cas4
MYSDDELLPLSGLQHLAYCERQWGLIHLEQVWEESADTLRGDYFHERADTVGYSCARGVRAERRVRLASHRLGLYGVADIVEFSESPTGRSVLPVEYKVGRPKREAWDRLQVAAQAACLEEMYGLDVPEGCLFYGATRRREMVDIDASLRAELERLSFHMHELYERQVLPEAARSTRCKRCSLADRCLPESLRCDAASYWTDMGVKWGE